MELRELRYFLAVAREESITKAAEQLYITQPCLSKQMQNLEREVGSPLFLRGSRKITLTETGLLLKKRAEDILALYEKMETELAAPPEEMAGEVFIGGGESYAVSTVARAAKQVQDRFPAVKFNFFSGDASSVKERLDKGIIDFGVVLDLYDLAGYNALRLPHADRWGVLVRSDDPLSGREFVTADDLLSRPVISSMQSLAKDSRLHRWFEGRAERLNVVARYNLLYNASLLVRAGMGCALGLEHLIDTSTESGLRFVPLYPVLETHLDVIWRKYALFSPPAQVFLDTLRGMI